MRSLALLSFLFVATALGAQVSHQAAPSRQGGDVRLSPVASGLFRPAPAIPQAAAPKGAPAILYDEPEGAPHNRQLRSGFRFQNTTQGVDGQLYDNAVGRYVEAEDGSIYVYEPFNSLATLSWLKLDKVGEGRYVARTPQPIYQNNGYTYYATWMKMARLDGHTYGYVPDTINGRPDFDMEFTLRDGVLEIADTARFEDTRYPLHMLCLANDAHEWTGYGEAFTRIEPLGEAAAQLPAGLQPTDYALETTSLNSVTEEVTSVRKMTKAAFDGDDVYLLNPRDSLSWMKGRLEGGKAVFRQQYIGADEAQSLHLWLFPATYSIVEDSSLIEYGFVFHIRNYSKAGQIALNYDAANGSLTADEGTSMLLNAHPGSIFYLETLDDPEYRRFTEREATPRPPVFMDVWGYDATALSGQIQFYLFPKSTTGEDLNSDKLYYSFYVDDESKPYVFTPHIYDGLSEDMTEVPYNFSDGYYFYSTNDIKSFFYYFDEQLHDRLGLQSVYRGMGVEHRSSIVWMDTSTLGIGSLSDGGGRRASAPAYFDLSGRRLDKPRPGVTLVRQNGRVRKVVGK